MMPGSALNCLLTSLIIAWAAFPTALIASEANKKTSIEIPRVRAKLKEINALPLLGDYTRLPADITGELQRHGRAGVPLVLVYPRNADAPPIVLPELLTPQIVLDALTKSGS